jgi:hypothetical protein
MSEVYKNRNKILDQDIFSLQQEYLTFCSKIEQIEYIEKRFGPTITK